MSKASAATPEPVRIDKWLWAARFFKTRSLAAEAVGGGKVLVNNQRIKPSYHMIVGATLTIRRGEYEHVIIVRGLARQRGPASVAAQLYEETPESIAKREALAEQLKLHALAAPRPDQRPSKRDRRRIIRFTSNEV